VVAWVVKRLFKRNDEKMKRIKNLSLIKKHEGLRLEAYLPTPNDVWTIGYGHTHTTKKGQKITEAQAEELLRRDIAWAEEAVNKLVVVPLTQNQFDALVSFVFNVGVGAFSKSTLLRLLNAKDYEGAANQFLRWNKQKGKVLNGLTKRREEERKLFLS
jgi:lysozyme